MAFVSCQEGDVNMGKQVLGKLLASKYCWFWQQVDVST